jgi:hypothetical protein
VNATTNKISTLSKLYVWSISLESLLFFVILNPDVIGVTANISKLLQLLVLTVLFFHFSMLYVARMPSPFSSFNKWFFYYFIFAIVSGIFGFLSGAYKNEIYDMTATNALSISIRPLFEYFILLYYFIYFTILPRYILNNSKSIEYFFKIFVSLFFIVLFVGFGDLLMMKIISGYDGLPRHLSDGTQVGWRFHGFAGEPRDAFSYLMLGLGILVLRDMWSGEKKLNKYLITLIFVAASLTQSASGLIGLLFSGLLMVLFLFFKFTNGQKVKYLILFITVVFFIVISASFSDRIMLYYDALFELIPSLKDSGRVDSILSVTMNNIYPLWQRWLEISEFNLLPTLIGTGLGSTSVINNNFFNTFEVMNPNANIIRSLYEVGIIGTYLFVYAFLNPIKKIKLFKYEYLMLTMLMLLMLGMFFAHRSVLPFLFIGVVLAAFNCKLSRKN